MADNTNTNNANPDSSSAADSAENNEQTNSAENTAQKKYSDDEVNSLVKNNSEKAVQKLMKELGITDKEKTMVNEIALTYLQFTVILLMYLYCKVIK